MGYDRLAGQSMLRTGSVILGLNIVITFRKIVSNLDINQVSLTVNALFKIQDYFNFNYLEILNIFSTSYVSVSLSNLTPRRNDDNINRQNREHHYDPRHQ